MNILVQPTFKTVRISVDILIESKIRSHSISHYNIFSYVWAYPELLYIRTKYSATLTAHNNRRHSKAQTFQMPTHREREKTNRRQCFDERSGTMQTHIANCQKIKTKLNSFSLARSNLAKNWKCLPTNAQKCCWPFGQEPPMCWCFVGVFCDIEHALAFTLHFDGSFWVK